MNLVLKTRNFALKTRNFVSNKDSCIKNDEFSRKREAGSLAEMRYIPLSLVQELINATFSERISPNNRAAIMAYADKEAVMWTTPNQEQAPAASGTTSKSGGLGSMNMSGGGSTFVATSTLTSGTNASMNSAAKKGTFQSAFGVSHAYGGNDELPVVLDEARLLELLMQVSAY